MDAPDPVGGREPSLLVVLVTPVGRSREPGAGGGEPVLVGVEVPAGQPGGEQVGFGGGEDGAGVGQPVQVDGRVEQAVVGHAGPEDGVGVPGLFAALLPEPGDQRLDGGGLLGDGEQGAGARQDLAPGGGHGFDAPGGGGGGQRGLHPVAAEHADRLGVADDRDVDDPLEQGGFGAEAHVHG